ncbi:hypothetical protein [Prauserella endophytica]|uniref:PPE domain-containing protein n=1 Tax=Prauserella endophytica TaxID=1592324 RepID=A0ABY2S3Y7_9PSEU|nr:hypothetical protein [Prauserella endophytica]TKG70042.1 hypothetical protein FCN18_18250 [Prauserella endophytica]
MAFENSGQPQPGSTVPLGDNSEVADIVQQARGRADGFAYGDDRAIGDRPNWHAQESQQLYNFATVNNEPGTAEELGHSWSNHSASLSRASEDLYNAISELGAAWIGQGAGAAQGALVGIANSSAQASEAANTMSSRLAQQAAAAAELKKMPQPVEFDPGQQTAAMLAGGPAAMVKDMKPQFDAANDVKAQQVAYLEAYTTAMSEIDGTTPSFGPESLGLKPLAGTPGSYAGPVGGVGGYGGPGAGAPGAMLAGLGATPPIVTQGADNGVAASGFTGGPHQAPPQAPAAAAPAPGPGAGTGTGAGSVPAAPPASSGGPNLAALGGAVAGGALGYAGARSLAKGSRSGSTKQSSTDTTASGNSQQAGSAASVAPQQQGVVNPAGTIGGAATPPAAPMGGMGGMGAGAAQQEEDKEHTHASFLIEADPDETFGATQATPPPVLGAWGPDDDEER